jgi:shikimate 5-dehydrogenase
VSGWNRVRGNDAWATRAGARLVGGLQVLVRQAARSFAISTGREPSLDVMRAAATGG